MLCVVLFDEGGVEFCCGECVFYCVGIDLFGLVDVLVELDDFYLVVDVDECVGGWVYVGDE